MWVRSCVWDETRDVTRRQQHHHLHSTWKFLHICDVRCVAVSTRYSTTLYKFVRWQHTMWHANITSVFRSSFEEYMRSGSVLFSHRRHMSGTRESDKNASSFTTKHLRAIERSRSNRIEMETASNTKCTSLNQQPTNISIVNEPSVLQLWFRLENIHRVLIAKLQIKNFNTQSNPHSCRVANISWLS